MLFFLPLSEISTHNFLQTSPAVHSKEESGTQRFICFFFFFLTFSSENVNLKFQGGIICPAGSGKQDIGPTEGALGLKFQFELLEPNLPTVADL